MIKGSIIFQAESLRPEKFVNLLWENQIKIEDLKKNNIASVVMKVSLKDYYKILKIAKTTETKITIIDMRGMFFFVRKLKKSISLVFGGLLFFIVLHFLSTFLWSISIETEKNISPYEIRQQLNILGIHSGIKKSKLNIKELEQRLLNENEGVMWVKVRYEGSELKIKISERQIPPKPKEESLTYDVVAKQDGQIIRVYTLLGTALVKPKDMVKKGQILIKGQQGKEGNTYEVRAKGNIIARTYYEATKTLPLKEIKEESTGRTNSRIFIVFNNKRIQLNKGKLKFEKYKKDTNSFWIFERENYYEIKNTVNYLSYDNVNKKVGEELLTKVVVNLDKSVKIIDKVITSKFDGNNYIVRVLVTVEEDIGTP